MDFQKIVKDQEENFQKIIRHKLNIGYLDNLNKSLTLTKSLQTKLNDWRPAGTTPFKPEDEIQMLRYKIEALELNQKLFTTEKQLAIYGDHVKTVNEWYLPLELEYMENGNTLLTDLETLAMNDPELKDFLEQVVKSNPKDPQHLMVYKYLLLKNVKEQLNFTPGKSEETKTFKITRHP